MKLVALLTFFVLTQNNVIGSTLRGFSNEESTITENEQSQVEHHRHLQHFAPPREWGVFGSDFKNIDKNFANLHAPYDKRRDTAFFFMIPKSGTTTLGAYMSQCVDLVLASRVGSFYADNRLEVVNLEGRKYVNVDVTTRDGLTHAGHVHLAESAKSDVIISGFVHQVASIFNTKNQARMFTLMRHPLQRVVSEFYYVQIADWEPFAYKPWLKDWTLDQYVLSDYFVDNWVTRQLVGKSSKAATLTYADFEKAKEILREKCLIGLSAEYKESVIRFREYFGWQDNDGCLESLFAPGGKMNTNRHPKLDKRSKAYQVLVEVDKWDILVYGYAKQLFAEQGKMFKNTALK